MLRQVKTSRDVTGGPKALEAILADGLPDAIFAHQDLLAAGIVTECHRRGIQVPDDVAIVGFDDSKPSAAARDHHGRAAAGGLR